MSVGEFPTNERAVKDMNGMGSMCCDKSLPPLLRMASAGAYPVFPETFLVEDFKSSKSASRRSSFSDCEKGVLSRSQSLHMCELDDEAQKIESKFHFRPCSSELSLTSDMRNFDSKMEKKIGRASFSKFGLVRTKVAPISPDVKIEFPTDFSLKNEHKPVPNERFFSQPNPEKGAHHPAVPKEFRRHSGPLPGPNRQNMATDEDDSYAFLKTKAPKQERFLTRLYSIRHQDQRNQAGTFYSDETGQPGVQNAIPVGRYLDALKGPELDILRESENTLLPVDRKWPFLLRFPINCFGICLGLGSQTILWKTLSSAPTVHFLHAPRIINVALWFLALIALVTVFATYFLKCYFYFEAVRREFYHPIRINFFFAPWIACMFLTLGAPPALTRSIHPVLWFLFMTPVFALELKIYGQWLSGGERRLSKVANPATHLSLVGNFVGSLLAATVGLKELAIFFWAVGLAHHLVLFVTLYQRLPFAAVLPKELHPIFFLFVAAPSTASVAWAKIVGDFDFVSRIAYFVGLFLYLSLVVRVNFFRGFCFSVSWWAYTFPMTASAIATIHYSLEVNNPFTQALAVLLSFISSFTVLSLCLFTILHTFFWCNMFPNDMAIAITNGSFRVKRRIKELDSDDSCSIASSKRVLHENSSPWHLGKCVGAVKVMDSIQSSLPTVRSSSFALLRV